MAISKGQWQWVAQAWYLTYFSSEVCINPFINIYMQSQGLSEAQIGIIRAVQPWLGVPVSFLWSMSADYFRAHRPLMLFMLLSSNAVRLLLPAVSSFPAFFCVILAGECLGGQVTIMADSAVTGSCTEDGEYGRYRLWGAVGWGGMSTVAGALLDAYGIGAAYALNLSFMLPAFCLSWFLWRPKAQSGEEELREGPKHSIEVRHINGKHSTNSTADLEMIVQEQRELAHRRQPAHDLHNGQATRLLLPQDTGGTGHDLELELQQQGPACVKELSFGTKVYCIFSRTESLVFFWTAIVMGAGFGMIEGFLFLLLKDLGATDMLLGFTLTLTCAAEVPVFRLQGWMLKKLGSADVLLDICLCAYVIRMLCYAALPYMKSPWWVLPVEPLHGLTFACGWGAGCEKSKALAPPGLEATQQGIFQGLYFGLGYGMGALLGGLIAEGWGFQVMYLVGAGIVAAGWGLARLGRWVATRAERMQGTKYALVMSTAVA